jgi:putative heme-binding domain-containing protein
MNRSRFFLWAALVALSINQLAASAVADTALFDRQNLVAWCIVPFDSAKRSPEQRAAMLAKLGITQLAYDWRDEHIPQFDEEVEAMRRHGVRITAWWIAPPDLNETNRKILDVVRRHQLKLQFWALVGDPDLNLPQVEKVRRAADALRPLAAEAKQLGCQVGLYNHGGWFGEPENQLEVLQAIGLDNVGLVYNLHHGHAHLNRFPAMLAKIKPHLLAINLNGMTPRGDEQGNKILPIGAGELDLQLLKTIRDSGYQGPLGILNHTDLDAEARLTDNLAGLDWLVKQLCGEAAGPRPKMPTYDPPATAPAADDHSAAERAQIEQLLAAARQEGDLARGAAVFASQQFACVSCHRVGKHGGAIGPELTKLAATTAPDQIVESLLWPKRQVKPEFVATAIATTSGTLHQGYIVRESAAEVVLRDATTAEELKFAAGDIDQRQSIGTLMPDGLSTAMTSQQRRDVVRFLLELGRGDAHQLDQMVGLAHQPASFVCDFGPLEPDQWRYERHHVNRDRLYDFYAKEADYFRNLPFAVAILPAYPGIDGGRYGHWGNQDEQFWRDDRWNQMNCGPVRCGIFRHGELVVPRAVCVQLNAPAGLAVCFNPQTMRYEFGWQDGFVNYSAVRHGFVDGLAIAGKPLTLSDTAPPAGKLRYRGYYRHANQVLFAYDVDGRRYLDAPTCVDGQFKSIVAPADEHPDADLTRGGPAQWPQVLETSGRLATEQGAYVIDTIEPPTKNPWNALFFFGGHDFLADGSAMLCTMHGDVWHVTGLDADLQRVRWKRFAAGLHHLQGLVVAGDAVYVLGRDQITRLHDLNGDDEADYYECVSQAYETSPAGHDFICGLERDPSGDFYTVSGNQGLLRVSANGERAQVLATGFRNPDGFGLLPDGGITVPCSEGEWTATSMICLVPPSVPDGAIPHYGYRGPINGQPPQLPLVYLPRGLDNSSGGQIFVNSDRFGPLSRQLIHFSYGAGTSFLVLRDEVAGQPQGAVVPLPGDFASGPHRGRVHPLDGQLYVSCMGGWGTYTASDGSFERVRYTGQPAQLPLGFHVYQNGVRVTFAQPIDSTLASDIKSHFAQAWNYRYSSAYGSAEYVPSHPGAVGHDRLEITSAHALPDGRSLFLEMPELQPVNQLHLRMRVSGAAPQELYATVHRLDEPFTDYKGYAPRDKIVAAHPLLADLEMLARPPEPNPWHAAIEGARELRVEAGKNLTFVTRSLTVRPGEPIKLVFANPDVVPHNWVLIRPGSLARVGDLVNRLVADPEAARRHYVPQSDDVLAYTDIVPPTQEFVIYFRAPQQPGQYPFLCSFPGHWMVMNGLLSVAAE